ncbi:MAG: hypothetical protein WDN72_09700 [Alphaproteobacteria bacterium]
MTAVAFAQSAPQPVDSPSLQLDKSRTSTSPPIRSRCTRPADGDLHRQRHRHAGPHQDARRQDGRALS